MPPQIPSLSSFSLIRRGKDFLLIRENCKDLLLRAGIDQVERFFRGTGGGIRHLRGRVPHPSLPIDADRHVVIRKYMHGGLLRLVTKDLFLFGSRSFRELALTEEIRSCGIPTVEPVAAIHHTVSPFFYRAYLLTLEIPEALNFVEMFQAIGTVPVFERLAAKRRIIRSAGLLLRRFHEAGFFHRDLQLKNILVAGETPLLIDFDRSYRKQNLPLAGRMKNLLRLNRSAEKWKQLGLPVTRTDRWRFFSAYAGEDARIRISMKRALRNYSHRAFLYRCIWTLEGVFRQRKEQEFTTETQSTQCGVAATKSEARNPKFETNSND